MSAESPAEPPVLRSRYYDALLSHLDRVVQPEISSDRARFLYAAVRRMLANFAVANEQVPHLPEHLAALHTPAFAADASLRDAVLAEGARLDAIELKVSQRLNPPQDAASETGQAAAPVTQARVQAWLTSALSAGVVIRSFRILAGGRSKQTIMLGLEDGRGERFERVIRRDLLVGVTDATVVDEYAVLTELAERGIPVPRPLRLELDAAHLGSAFMLMEKVEGAVAGDVFDPPPSAAQVLASAHELARLHALPAAELAGSLRPDRSVAPDTARLRDEISALRKGWSEQARASSATLDAAFAWLLDHVAAIEQRPCVVHGDYSYHNILYDGGTLSAVMDWELVRLGHPAEDLGYVRAAARQRVPWADFLSAYAAAGGPVLPERELMFYTMLAKLRLMAMLLRARGYFEAGYTDDLQIAAVSVHHLSRLVHQLSVDVRSLGDFS
jgi:aminoglycoside phosphotransferase (APT) family kinase protein